MNILTQLRQLLMAAKPEPKPEPEKPVPNTFDQGLKAAADFIETTAQTKSKQEFGREGLMFLARQIRELKRGEK